MRTRDAVLLLLGCAWLASAGTVESRAARILIRTIDVEDTSPREVFEFLKEQAKAADPEGKGQNMLFRFTPAGQRIFEESTVTLKLNNVPLNAVVRYVCLASGLLYSYDENALMVFDSKAAQPRMETRVYHMGAGVVDSPRTRQKAKSLDKDFGK
jgi:hypothetical protein